MGKRVGQLVGARLGRALLELGGNNAVIVSNKGNLQNALRAVVFGNVGTCGQRCTSTRRVIIHSEVYDQFKSMLINAYKQVKIGSPLDEANHMGPLIDKQAVDAYLGAIKELENQGGRVVSVVKY